MVNVLHPPINVGIDDGGKSAIFPFILSLCLFLFALPLWHLFAASLLKPSRVSIHSYVIISNCLHWSKCFKFELIDWLIECFDLSSSYHLARNQFFWLLASSVRLKYQRGNCSFCATAIHSCRFGETRRSVHKTRSTASYTYSVLIALFPLAPSTRLKLLVHWCHPSNAILWISLGWWRARLLSTESCAYLNIPLDRSGRN